MNELKQYRRPVSLPSIREISFLANENAPDFIVDVLFDWLGAYVEQGAEIRHDQTLQFGFVVLKFQVADGCVSLQCPDFQGMPIEWTDDLTMCFHAVAAHRYVPESVGLPVDIPGLLDTAIVGDRFDELPMFMDRQERSEANPNDSGWFVGSLRDDVDNNDQNALRLMSLYEIVVRVPHVFDYLSLPAGCTATFNSERPELLQGGNALTVPPDSYLGMRWDMRGAD